MASRTVKSSAPSPKAPEAIGPILVVDDTAWNRSLLKAMLEQAGHTVIVAASGAEAIGIVKREHPAIVLLDFMMPTLDGPHVLRILRQHGSTSDTPVIMLTASDLPAHIEQAFAAGADDYLLKPVDRRILLTRVNAVIRARADQQQAARTYVAERERDALMTELEDAREVQKAQLPPMPQRWEGWAANGVVVPSGAIGGDLFDVMRSKPGYKTAVLIDVSGHGVAAAMVASSVRSTLRLLLREYSLGEAFAKLNRHMAEDNSLRYACAAAVELGANEVAILNAGLPPISVLRGGKVIAEVSSSGVPPGLMPNQSYEMRTVEIRPGDRVILVSDGVTEPFGLPDDTANCLKYLGLVGGSMRSSGERALDELDVLVRRMVEGAAGVQPDDATVLLLERTGE